MATMANSRFGGPQERAPLSVSREIGVYVFKESKVPLKSILCKVGQRHGPKRDRQHRKDLLPDIISRAATSSCLDRLTPSAVVNPKHVVCSYFITCGIMSDFKPDLHYHMQSTRAAELLSYERKRNFKGNFKVTEMVGSSVASFRKVVDVTLQMPSARQAVSPKYLLLL